MKKLGYLAIALISIFALASCVINVNDDNGKNYIRVTWVSGQAPASWTSSNVAITNSVYDPEDVNDVGLKASPAELSTLQSSKATESGDFTLTYRASDDIHLFDCDYTIPKNYSSFDKNYVLVLDDSHTKGGYLYED